jgi:hypothetical protein
MSADDLKCTLKLHVHQICYSSSSVYINRDMNLSQERPRWKMAGITGVMNMKLAARPSSGRHSRGCRPAVVPSAGKQMLLVRRHPPGSASWPTRATGGGGGGVPAGATAADSSGQAKEEEEEDRASRNTSSFEPSIWGDFFLTYSSPLATSSAQKVCNNL